MTGAPWYRRFPGDFIEGTTELTLEETGAYALVLDLIYKRGGPIPDDRFFIAKVCRCSPRLWTKLRERLLSLGKLVLDPATGTLMNRRCALELQRMTRGNNAKISPKSVENERVSLDYSTLVSQDAQKTQSGDHAADTMSSTGFHGSKTPPILPDNSLSQQLTGGRFLETQISKKERKNLTLTPPKTRTREEPEFAWSAPTAEQPAAARVRSEESSFSLFMSLYPKQENRGQALQQYRKALKEGVPAFTILTGLLNYTFPTEYRFIPKPAAWLFGQCWLDNKPDRKQFGDPGFAQYWDQAEDGDAPDQPGKWLCKLTTGEYRVVTGSTGHAD